MKHTPQDLSSIPGFTFGAKADDRPSIGVFGVEGTGKTELATTMPCTEGVIGVIALDKKCKRTFEMASAKNPSIRYIANTQPFISDKEMVKMSMLGDLESPTDKNKREADIEEAKAVYSKVLERVFDAAGSLAGSNKVESVVTDTTSQLWNWILYASFGRTSKIPPVSRGAANQLMIDYVNLLRSKNTLFIHRASEIWEPDGFDSQGKEKRKPSGRYEPQGFKDMGAYITANLEMTNNNAIKIPAEDHQDFDAKLNKKFRVKVYRSQTNALLEGQWLDDYGVCGRGINWDMLTAVLGMEG